MIGDIKILIASRITMKKLTGQLALALAVLSLAGCGLKGPLYFPKDEPAQPSAQTVSPMQSDSHSSTSDASSKQDNQAAQ